MLTFAHPQASYSPECDGSLRTKILDLMGRLIEASGCGVPCPYNPGVKRLEKVPASQTSVALLGLWKGKVEGMPSAMAIKSAVDPETVLAVGEKLKVPLLTLI